MSPRESQRIREQLDTELKGEERIGRRNQEKQMKRLDQE